MKATSKRVTPPLIGIGHLRRAHQLTLAQVADGIQAITGRRYAEGTLNAVEIGADRPGPKLTAALLAFYELLDDNGGVLPHVYFAPRLVPTATSVARDEVA